MLHPPGSLRVFTKSGNLVRVIERVREKTYRGLYLVQRVDGRSKGKGMLVPGSSLKEPK